MIKIAMDTEISNWLLLLSLTFSASMTGFIWLVQIYVYPHFREVVFDKWSTHHDFHVKRISAVVIPLMIGELACSLGAAWFFASDPLFQITLFLLFLIWASTFAIQVPLHYKLKSGHNEAVIDLLITTNWLRTIAWSVKTVLLFAVLI